MSTKQENDLVKAIHDKELFDHIMPALRELAKHGSIESMLKKSSPLAVMKMIKLLNSEKEEVVLKAAEKIIAYDIGKPVERSVSIFGDVKDMSEKDVDARLLALFEKTGAQKVLAPVIDTKALPAAKPKQRRKPRKSDPLANGQEEPSEGSQEPNA